MLRLAVATTFGKNLLAARKARRLTQEDVAKALGYKRARNSAVSLWENDVVFPEPDTVYRLAMMVLKCAPRDLLDGVETPYDRLRAGTYRPRAPVRGRTASS